MALAFFFLGRENIGFAILFSAISGFAAGAVPAANFSMLSKIAPDNLKDKVAGWSDAVCASGLIVATMLCGFLAADGVWTRGYAVYFSVIPILILVLLFYPANSRDASVESAEAVKNNEVDSSAIKEKIPVCIIVLLVLKVFSGMFYNSFGVFSSDFIINDLQLGTSAIVGVINTLCHVANVLSALLVFAWLKGFRGFSTLVSQVIIGGALLGIVTVGRSAIILAILAVLLYVGLESSHSSMSTIMANAPKGSAVGTVSGIFMSATFIGESICGYAAPFFANLFLGSSSAADCMKISGIMSIVVGIASIPFFIQAYRLAFPKEQLTEAK